MSYQGKREVFEKEKVNKERKDVSIITIHVPELILGPELKHNKIFTNYIYSSISTNIQPNLIKHIPLYIPLESPSFKNSNGSKNIHFGLLVTEGWSSKISITFFTNVTLSSFLKKILKLISLLIFNKF